ASYERPLPAITLGEVLATSDVPGGVVNILTGKLSDTAPWLAAHMDVNAIDLAGAAGDSAHARDLELAATDNLKRVVRAPEAEPAWTAEPDLERITALLETKTVWHPVGDSARRTARARGSLAGSRCAAAGRRPRLTGRLTSPLTSRWRASVRVIRVGAGGQLGAVRGFRRRRNARAGHVGLGNEARVHVGPPRVGDDE